MMKPEQHSIIQSTACNQFKKTSATDQDVSASNVMPSMVARQQRALYNSSATATATRTAPVKPQPAPRTSHTNSSNNNYISHIHNTVSNQQKPQFDQDGLILAKRPLQNPNLAMLSTAQSNLNQDHHSTNSSSINNNNIINHDLIHGQNVNPLMRDLNRELKFNQINGKNVLDQKSELKRVQERLAETRRKKEAEQERLNRRSSLELRLEERAQKIAREGG